MTVTGPGGDAMHYMRFFVLAVILLGILALCST